MSVLRTLESKLAGLVEGTFSRAFKSEVRPVEIARKLAREMDENRVQSLSRSFYASLIPKESAGQFFGFYNMLGKFAAVLGPLVVGLTASLTGNPRLAIFVLVFFFAAGMLLLARVRPHQA